MTTTTRQVTAATPEQALVAGAAKVAASLPAGTAVKATKAVKGVTTKAQRATIARYPAEQPWDVTVEYDLAQAVELTERAKVGDRVRSNDAQHVVGNVIEAREVDVTFKVENGYGVTTRPHGRYTVIERLSELPTHTSGVELSIDITHVRNLPLTAQEIAAKVAEFLVRELDLTASTTPVTTMGRRAIAGHEANGLTVTLRSAAIVTLNDKAAHEFVPTRSGKCDVCGRDKRTTSHGFAAKAAEATNGQHAAHIAAGTYAPECPTCIELRGEAK